MDSIHEQADHQPCGGLRWGMALNRVGVPVARCTVEQLMAQLGLRGAVRGKVKRTTIAGVGPKPADPVGGDFEPLAPNRLWVADFTYVSTWAGWVYVAFVIAAYARRILGWRAATSMTADLVLDAVEQAIWVREHEGRADFTALVAHHDHGSQYLSLAHTQRLAEAGIRPSVGAVGSSYDTPWPSPSTGCTRPRSSDAKDRGATSTPSNWPAPNRSTGITTAASTRAMVASCHASMSR